jgi:hypothetical protein
MRRLWDIDIRNGGTRIALSPRLARDIGSQEVDHSQAGALREIAWSLAGWLGFVGGVQLLLHAFGIS